MGPRFWTNTLADPRRRFARCLWYGGRNHSRKRARRRRRGSIGLARPLIRCWWSQDAEQEQSEKGDASELHIVIFDEIDAICKKRGSTRDGTGVHDSIVNQVREDSGVERGRSSNVISPGRPRSCCPRLTAWTR